MQANEHNKNSKIVLLFLKAGQTGWIEYPLVSSAAPFNRYFIQH